MNESVYICVNCPTRDTRTLVIRRALLLHVWTNQRGLFQCMTWLGLRGQKLKRNRRFRLRVGTTVGSSSPSLACRGIKRLKPSETISNVATLIKPMRKYHEYTMSVLRFIVWPFASDFSQIAAENDKSNSSNR